MQLLIIPVFIFLFALVLRYVLVRIIAACRQIRPRSRRSCSDHIADGCSDPRICITLIHGTFAPDAAWTRPGSALAQQLLSTFDDAHVSRFRWSGRNSFLARQRAAQRLAARIGELRWKHPKAKQIIVGHSHGGSIALQSANLANWDSAEPDGVACLSTPFIHISRHMEVFSIALSWIHSISIMCVILVILFLATIAVYPPVATFWPFYYLYRHTEDVTTTTLLGVEITSVNEGADVATLMFLMTMTSALLAYSVRRRVFNMIDKLGALCPAPGATGNTLILRITGDEASGGLSLARFSQWVTKHVIYIPINILFEGLVSMPTETSSWLKKILLAPLFLVAGYAFLSAAFLLVPLLVPLVVASMLLSMLAFGPEAAFLSALYDIRVETLPVGSVTASCKDVEYSGPLRHSAVYEDNEMIDELTDWIRETASK